jgi:hypothetical protein
MLADRLMPPFWLELHLPELPRLFSTENRKCRRSGEPSVIEEQLCIVQESFGVLSSAIVAPSGLLAVFVIDHVKADGETSASEPQKIVNWDVAEQKLRSSLDTIKEEVHEATR